MKCCCCCLMLINVVAVAGIVIGDLANVAVGKVDDFGSNRLNLVAALALWLQHVGVVVV